MNPHGKMIESDAVNDPVGIMTVHFARLPAKAFLDAERIAIFRDLDTQMKLASFVTGHLTGLLSTVLSGARKEDRDGIVNFVRATLDAARLNAEAEIEEFYRQNGVTK